MKTISKRELISKTLESMNKNRDEYQKLCRADIEEFVNAYEAEILNCLSKADAETPEVMTKPFSGLRITATYKPDREIKIYGEQRQAKAKIFYTAKTTRFFECENK